jgi:hypothetical protein
MPFRDGELTGHNGGAESVAVVENFDEVTAVLVLERGMAPIVDDQDLDAGEAGEGPDVGSVGASEGELVDES